MTYPIELQSGNVVRFAGDLTFTGSQPTGQSTSALTGLQYVTTDGDDTHDGYSWQSAKRTVQAAINALPLASDGISRNGIVEVGYGTFPVVSGASRVDTGCTITQGSATVLDSSAGSSDVGAWVIGSGATTPPGVTIPPYAKIVSVTPGVSFVMSSPGPSGTGTGSVQIHKPAIALSPGVTLRGRGRMNGLASGLSVNYPTAIVDSGTGVTLLAPTGSGPGKSASSSSTVGVTLESLSVIGNAGNTDGFYAANIWSIVIRGCEFRGHGRWGINLDSNSPVHCGIYDSECRENGTVGAAVATGGLNVSTNPNVFIAVNFRSMFNWGFAVYGAIGGSYIGCELQYTATTAFSGSGVGAQAIGGVGNGTVKFDHCWFEGNAGTYQAAPGNPLTVFTSCMFQGGSVTPNGIGLGTAAPVVLDGCYFQGHTVASLKLAQSGSGSLLSWRACSSVDPLWAKSFSGSGNDLAAALALTAGTTGLPVVFTSLPTSDPLVKGQVWANSGVLTLSAG